MNARWALSASGATRRRSAISSSRTLAFWTKVRSRAGLPCIHRRPRDDHWRPRGLILDQRLGDDRRGFEDQPGAMEDRSIDQRPAQHLSAATDHHPGQASQYQAVVQRGQEPRASAPSTARTKTWAPFRACDRGASVRVREA